MFVINTEKFLCVTYICNVGNKDKIWMIINKAS